MFMTYSASWSSPSNIALVKYWGKHGLQWPQNPSLSFTLSACSTKMYVAVTLKAPSFGLQVFYNGSPRPSFEPKIQKLCTLVEDRFPWLKHAHVVVDSSNTFPHGAGIASSASSMSALALCLMDIHGQINGDSQMDDDWWRKVSEISRLGSGSACRSVFPKAALWGVTAGIMDSSDDYAIPWAHGLAEVYTTFCDTILIVSSQEKSVSSTAGHALMDELPYAPVRYAEARKHLTSLLEVMQHDDKLDQFIEIVESEALQLHALMMSGKRPFILMEPGTLSIIKEIWRFRKDTSIPVCFTLDAGPNVHLLYPAEHARVVLDWIKTVLSKCCADGLYILDSVGAGPEKIS